MKIALIIVSVVLVIVGAGSGYFIASLNGNVSNLKTELAANYDSLGTKIDQAGTRLEGEIKAGDDSLNAGIQQNQSALQQFKDTASQQITGLQDTVQSNTDKLDSVSTQVNSFSGEIDNLGNRVVQAENTINDNIMQTPALYTEAAKAIVRITDGSSLGSGFIMAANPGAPVSTNKIVTAYHVIADMSTIYVMLQDGRSWKARLWAGSQAADIAILQFTTDSADLPDMATLPALKLGDSEAVKPGAPVFIIGSPGGGSDALGLEGTVTSGIVSYTHRAELVESSYVANLIQIDAPVNFGNSGGPLLNSRGEVIGVINSRISPTQGDGISFCVASDMIKRVEKIITNGSGRFNFSYPYLGIGMQDLDPADIAAGNNAVPLGAKVVSLTGPALAASVKVGDIITAINGTAISNSSDLSSWMAENATPGDDVVLTVVRGDMVINITVTAGTRS